MNSSEPIYDISTRASTQYRPLLIIGGIMVVLLFLARGFMYLGPGTLMTALWVGFALSIIVAALLEPWFIRRINARLKASLIKKYEKALALDLSQAIFVGITPGLAARLYAGDSILDVGLFILEPGIMHYYGDITSFDIRSNQVIKVKVCPPAAFSLWTNPLIEVSWRETNVSHWKQFTIEIREPVSKSEQLSLANSMAERIDVLRQSPVPEPEPQVILPNFLGISEILKHMIPPISCSHQLLVVSVFIITGLIIFGLVYPLYISFYHIWSFNLLNNILIFLLGKGIIDYTWYWIVRKHMHKKESQDTSNS